MDNWTLVAVIAVFLGVYVIFRLYNRISIADVPGPESDSFVFGWLCIAEVNGFVFLTYALFVQGIIISSCKAKSAR